MDRERELAELSAYVRTLADRMGLKDWTFEVDPDPDGDKADAVGLIVMEEFPRRALVVLSPDYFTASPEARRFALVRELVFHHLWIADEVDDVSPGEGTRAIAAAWAAALPLPLAGLMRRAAPALAREED